MLAQVIVWSTWSSLHENWLVYQKPSVDHFTFQITPLEIISQLAMNSKFKSVKWTRIFILKREMVVYYSKT